MLLDMNKFADGIKAIAEENKMLKEENKMLKESAIADLVLCKDCRYCTEYYDRDGYPYWECAEWDGGTDADGFCHYGEKKKEMKSELCKSCAHTNVCFKDKNLFGDVFVMGNPMIFDNRELYEKYKERERKGFPCDDYLSIDKIKEE